MPSATVSSTSPAISARAMIPSNDVAVAIGVRVPPGRLGERLAEHPRRDALDPRRQPPTVREVLVHGRRDRPIVAGGGTQAHQHRTATATVGS